MVSILFVSLSFSLATYAGIDSDLALAVLSEGDGVQFRVLNENVSEFSLTVHDLNGQTVFDSGSIRSFSTSWNLTDQSGKRLPLGIYLYTFLGKDASGKVLYRGVAKLFIGAGNVYGEGISSESSPEESLSRRGGKKASEDSSSDRYVIVFNGNKMPKRAAEIVGRAGGKIVNSLPRIGVAIATSSRPDFASKLRGAQGVHSAGLEGFHSLPPLEVKEFNETEPEGPTAADSG